MASRPHFLKGLNVSDEDFSGVVASDFGVSDCTFTRCGFEHLNVKGSSFGLGQGARYIECSFDNSALSSHAVGKAEFVRCTFRNVTLHTWISLGASYVGCEFSGTFRKGVISATDLGGSKNVIVDNDFSAMEFQDVAFRGGVDLSRQMLPQSPEVLILVHPAKVLDALRDVLARPAWAEHRDLCLRYRDSLIHDVQSGQSQLLIVPEHHYDLGHDADRHFLVALRTAARLAGESWVDAE